MLLSWPLLGLSRLAASPGLDPAGLSRLAAGLGLAPTGLSRLAAGLGLAPSGLSRLDWLSAETPLRIVLFLSPGKLGDTKRARPLFSGGALR